MSPYLTDAVSHGSGLLTALWLVPFVGAVLVALLPARDAARWTALTVSVATAAIGVVAAIRFDAAPDARDAATGGQFRLVESHSWIPAIGARYTLGLDGIALVLVLLTVLLVPLLLLAAWRDVAQGDRVDPDRDDAASGTVATRVRTGRATQTYFALFLAVEAMVLLSFVALDILLFYILFEAMLIPMYFLIGGFGGSGRARAAVRFLLYNLAGGLVMLAAVIGLYAATAADDSPFTSGTFDFRAIVAATASGDLALDPTVEKVLFLGFLFAFAVKAPLWPLHTWLPGAAVEATPAAAVLMMAVVDKVGTFAMLRYCLQLFPDASRWFAPVVVVLAVVGIVYGALVAIGQTDMMRLIAYTSISHFGFIVLGIFAFTSQAQSGATLYMVNHGVSTAALFLVAGFLVAQRGSRRIADYGGVVAAAPFLAASFLIAGLATLSLPGLAPFVSEVLVLIGTYTRYPVAAVVGTIALVLSAVYVLWLYQRVMTGPSTDDTRRLRDLVPREAAVVVPLLLVLVILGVYPRPALDTITPSVEAGLATIGEHDPVPGVDGDPLAVTTAPDGGER